METKAKELEHHVDLMIEAQLKYRVMQWRQQCEERNIYTNFICRPHHPECFYLNCLTQRRSYSSIVLNIIDQMSQAEGQLSFPLLKKIDGDYRDMIARAFHTQSGIIVAGFLPKDVIVACINIRSEQKFYNDGSVVFFYSTKEAKAKKPVQSYPVVPKSSHDVESSHTQARTRVTTKLTSHI